MHRITTRTKQKKNVGDPKVGITIIAEGVGKILLLSGRFESS